MPQITIEKFNGNKPVESTVLADIGRLIDRIRNSAFDLFERRGREEGHAEEDWLRAERDLILTPPAELLENGDAFTVRVDAAGFKPDDVTVVALPEALVVKAASSHRHDKTEGNVYFCEFGKKTFFRRFALPAAVAVESVTARLDNGILELTAPKAKQVKIVLAAAA